MCMDAQRSAREQQRSRAGSQARMLPVLPCAVDLRYPAPPGSRARSLAPRLCVPSAPRPPPPPLVPSTPACSVYPVRPPEPVQRVRRNLLCKQVSPRVEFRLGWSGPRSRVPPCLPRPALLLECRRERWRRARSPAPAACPPPTPPLPLLQAHRVPGVPRRAARLLPPGPNENDSAAGHVARQPASQGPGQGRRRRPARAAREGGQAAAAGRLAAAATAAGHRRPLPPLPRMLALRCAALLTPRSPPSPFCPHPCLALCESSVGWQLQAGSAGLENASAVVGWAAAPGGRTGGRAAAGGA